MKEPVIEQIRGIATNLSPEQLAPKEEASTNLVTTNLEQDCHQYGQVLPGKVDPTQCQVAGEKLNAASVGEKTSVTLQTVDKIGKEVSVPIWEISVELVCITDQIVTQCEVEEKGKGKYTITYTPATRGRHQLHIKIGQTPIGCSPLPVIAKLPPNRLGKPVRTIGNLTDPRGVAVNSSGQILVSESGKNHISVFSPNGQHVKTFGNVQYPWGICFDSRNNVLVAGHLDHQIHQFTPNGDHLRSIGGQGSNPLQFLSPIGIAYSNKSRKVYVSEYGNNRVQILNEDLSYSASFGPRGSGNGKLHCPHGVAVDSTGNVYVADYGNNRIQVFSPEGRFLRTIGTKGSDPGQLSAPYDVHVDGDDRVYVVEWVNKRVSVFTSQGQFLASFGQGQFSKPYGLTVDDDGSVIVIDSSNSRLVIF